MNKNNTPLKIVKTLKRVKKPLILNHIAKKARIAPQLVDYHLEQLIKKGIIVKIETDEKVYYALQGVFYEEGWITLFYEALTAIVEGVNECNLTVFDDIAVTNEKAIVNICITLLQLFEGELESAIKG